ncbi:ORF1a [polyscias crinivirus 1]|nr:ORF1a [polyscias crinivirus 1]
MPKETLSNELKVPCVNNASTSEFEEKTKNKEFNLSNFNYIKGKKNSLNYYVDFNDVKVKRAFQAVKQFERRRSSRTLRDRLFKSPLLLRRSLFGSEEHRLPPSSVRAEMELRMNVLRKLCNVPCARFNKLPTRVYRKFGFDVERINCAIDRFLDSKVGASLVSSNDVSETIEGKTRFGDGYLINLFEKTRHCEVFVKFGGYARNSADICVKLSRRYIREQSTYVMDVSAYKLNGVKVVSPWCDKFILYGGMTSGQRMILKLLRSVAEVVPDIFPRINSLKMPRFKADFSVIRAAFIRECEKFQRAVARSTKPSSPQHVSPKVPPSSYSRSLPTVTLSKNAEGAEVFIVKYNGGSERRIKNDDFAVRNLFNATLTSGRYFIHPNAYVPGRSFFKSKKSEYCWLEAFAMANKKIPDFVIPFPCLKVRILYSCGLQDVINKHCHLVGNNLYHFDKNYLSNKTVKSLDSFVGVKVDTEIPNLGQNINVIFDDLIGHYIQGTGLRSDNMLHGNIVNRLSDRINSMFNKPRELNISTTLNSAEKRKVIDMFPELSLNFLDSSYSSHPIATAIRSCENYIMAKRNNNQDFIDVGGDVVSTMMNELKDVHICTPVIDAKDSHRHMTRSAILDGMWGHKEKMSFCENKTEDCSVQKTNIVAVEVYDMTLKQMAQAILSHGAKRFDFSLIIPPEICDSECDVMLLNNSLRVSCNDGKVEYRYGEFGESYFHDRESLRDILRTQMFVYKGIVFKKTLECSREHLHFFSLVPCPGIQSGHYTLSSHYKRSESDKIEITIPVREKLGQIVDKRTSVDRALTYNLIEYVMNTALRVDDKAAEYLISQFRARKSMTIKGNKVIPHEFDLPIEYVPGYLAIVLAEGLRLREKIQFFAKISYHRHYSPSILKIFSLILKEFINRVGSLCYDSFVWLLRKCLSDSLLDKVIYGERRIHDCEYIMRFRQEITIVGERGSQSVLGESISSFMEACEKSEGGLTNFCDDNRQLFNPDDYDKLYDLVHGGGGASLNFGRVFGWVSGFDFYCKVFNFVSLLCPQKERVSKVTNFIVSVIDWMRLHSVTSMKFIKESFNVMVSAISGKISCSFSALWDKLKRCAKECKSLLQTETASLEAELDRLFSIDDEIKNRLEEQVIQVVRENTEVFTDVTLNDVEEEIVTSGGGFRSENAIVSKLKCCFKQFCAFLRSFLKNLTYVPELFREYYERLINSIRCRVVWPTVVEFTIQGTSFLCVNLLLTGFFGKLSLLFSFGATLLYLTIKLFGIERKFLGSPVVSEQICSMVSGLVYVNPILIPIRSLLMKTCQIYMKKQLLSHPLTAPIGTELIAKDIVGSGIYRHVTPYRVRMTIYLCLLLAILSPFLAGLLLIVTLLTAEHAKYYKGIAVRANVHLSFASKLQRLNPTARAKKLKALLIKKFDSKRVVADVDESTDGETSESPSSDDENHHINSQALVAGNIAFDNSLGVTELDYSGREIVRGRWGDVSDDESPLDVSQDTPEGLSFSSLDITSDRQKFVCDSDLVLSEALLQYPMVNIPTCVMSGDDFRDTFNEFFFLEKKKLFVELGKVNNVVDFYKSQIKNRQYSTSNLWNLRNKFDDSTLYVSFDSRRWFRLRMGDKGFEDFEAVCKYTDNNRLMSFKKKYVGFQVSSDELGGMYSNKRCLALQTTDLKFFEKDVESLSEKVVFYNKPPGAGKTTTIVKNMLNDIKSNVSCLALTCTNSGKKEIVHKLKKEGVNNAFSLVFTYDSLLINGSKPVVDVIYCDEIFMVHAGLWLAILSVVTFQRVECYGDKNQIPFINRVPNTLCHFSQKIYHKFKMFHDNVSYRCPPDVCHILSGLVDATGAKLYPNGVKSVGPNSNILRSMFVVPINSPEEIPYDPETKMIAFTKPEKDDIMKFGRNSEGLTNSAQTVNEVQGGTFKKVELYRLRQYDNPIYNDVNQFVVSISRHTEIMKYRVLSSKTRDTVGQSISNLETVADYIIKESAFKQRV